MKPQWETHISQLEAAVELWRASLHKQPTTITTAQGINVPTEEISRMLEETLASIQQVGSSDYVNGILLSIHQNGVISQIPPLVAAITNATSNPSPSYVDQISQHLWNIRASLVWLLPSRITTPEMAEAIGNLDIQEKLASVRSLSSELSKAVSDSSSLLKQATEVHSQANTALEAIKGFERAGATAKTNTEASAATALTNKDAISEQLALLTDGLTRQKELQAKIEELKNQAVTTLESASKVGLASSFNSSRKRLQNSKRIWGGGFLLGIISLVFVTFFSQQMLPPLIKNDQIDIGALLTRFLLSGPLIWLGWFSARQYGHALRLIEDYAFKEASALAFIGYQREMTSDVDMIKLLRESAIRNFGSEPARVFVKADPASPLHELLDKAIEKGAVEKFIDLIRALKPGR